MLFLHLCVFELSIVCSLFIVYALDLGSAIKAVNRDLYLLVDFDFVLCVMIIQSFACL